MLTCENKFLSVNGFDDINMTSLSQGQVQGGTFHVSSAFHVEGR